jgi:hypothetical protein
MGREQSRGIMGKAWGGHIDPGHTGCRPQAAVPWISVFWDAWHLPASCQDTQQSVEGVARDDGY